MIKSITGRASKSGKTSGWPLNGGHSQSTSQYNQSSSQYGGVATPLRNIHRDHSRPVLNNHQGSFHHESAFNNDDLVALDIEETSKN